MPPPSGWRLGQPWENPTIPGSPELRLNQRGGKIFAPLRGGFPQNPRVSRLKYRHEAGNRVLPNL
jgi:hypothetical protein